MSAATGTCRPRLDRGPQGARERALEVRGRLEAAVRSHLMSDVPLGVFLSGGLDSSVLAALMARLADEPIRTFAVGLDEPDANELRYARLVASAIGALHRDVTVTREQFFAALPRPRLARGRADRVPVERAAQLRLPAGRRAR